MRRRQSSSFPADSRADYRELATTGIATTFLALPGPLSGEIFQNLQICRAGLKTIAIDPDTERAARAFLSNVSAWFDISGAILFGSRSRRGHRADSDADVAVLLHGRPGKFAATKLAMADIAYDVLLETGIRVQPLPIWEDGGALGGNAEKSARAGTRRRNPALPQGTTIFFR
jgi:predicted nucleotidyltransferase